MIAVTVLGATGSIGVSTLDVIARHPDKYRAVALTANRNVEKLLEQCRQHKPDYAVLLDESKAAWLRDQLKQHGVKTEVLCGAKALEQVAALPQVDQVMAAIVGAAGLLPSLAAARAGKRVLLANKEALVMSGQLFMDEIKNAGAELLPIDSEHNAIFQCMPSRFEEGLAERGVDRILLTASGGPFRERSVESLVDVRPDEACAHPNWSMGRKISVDSATMMNKGLELIEACWLFHTGPDKVQVVVHPQSVIHSMVSYVDGSVLAQMGNPDMRTPIAHAMAWPERMGSGVAPLDVFDVARLDFEEPDLKRFPCLALAEQAAQSSGTAPAILNAANEIAVEAFLEERLGFTHIPELIDYCLQQVPVRVAADLQTVLEDDARGREVARQRIASHYA